MDPWVQIRMVSWYSSNTYGTIFSSILHLCHCLSILYNNDSFCFQLCFGWYTSGNLSIWWELQLIAECCGGTWAILSINIFLGVLARNVDPMWKPVTRSWSYSRVICLRKAWNILVIRDCDRCTIIFFITSSDYIPKAEAQNHQGT